MGAGPRRDGWAHLRLWKTSSFNISHISHGYNLKLGKEAVDEARSLSKLCTTYEKVYSDVGKIKHDLLDIVDLGVVAGVDDHFAICDKRTYDSNGRTYAACSAYLGRNHFLAQLTITVLADVAAARTKLTQVVPIAAATLVAAAP